MNDINDICDKYFAPIGLCNLCNLCNMCDGSGEGMVDGSVCQTCRGYGEWLGDSGDDE